MKVKIKNISIIGIAAKKIIINSDQKFECTISQNSTNKN